MIYVANEREKDVQQQLETLEVEAAAEKERLKTELDTLGERLNETNEKLKISTDANSKMAEQAEMNASELEKAQAKSKEIQKKLETKESEYKKLQTNFDALKVSKAKEKEAKKVVQASAPKSENAPLPSRTKKSEGGTSKYVEATAYTAFCDTGCTGVTATGVDVSDASKNYNIIAVDPSVIPLHSVVEIEGMGVFTALDTGGAIKGNKIDILVNSHNKAVNFGRKQLKIRIIRSGR